MNAADLIAEFPSTFRDPNKEFVYSIACSPGATHSGTIDYSRWQASPIPAEIDLSMLAEAVDVQQNFYDYLPVGDGNHAFEWHVNFADPFLFAAFDSGLFAQDEMQVAEHPVLGSLADFLTANGQAGRTVENGEPTPVLISGVERRCRVATDVNPDEGRPYGLYGNAFSMASIAAVERATEAIAPPTTTNLIAMAAPSYGSGRYRMEDVAYVLATAHTAFAAAREESARALGPGSETIVHTGFWGCGAFGGNRHMMTILQAVSACMAGIDRIVFHIADAAGEAAVREAMEMVGDVSPESRRGASILTTSFIEGVLGLGLSWGVSDGN